MSDITISTWASMSSSASPWAARTASSMVGGSRRTRRRPSFVFHSSLILCTPDLAAAFPALNPLSPHYQRFTAMQQAHLCAALMAKLLAKLMHVVDGRGMLNAGRVNPSADTRKAEGRRFPAHLQALSQVLAARRTTSYATP